MVVERLFWLYLLCCVIHCGAGWHLSISPRGRAKYNCAAFRNPSGEVTCASLFLAVTYFVLWVSNLEATCTEKGESSLLAAVLLPC